MRRDSKQSGYSFTSEQAFWVHQHKGNPARGITMLAWQIYIITEKNINEDAYIAASFASWATDLEETSGLRDWLKPIRRKY
jgi:hypothetical protein